MKILSFLLILIILPLANALEYKQEFYLQEKGTNTIITIDYEKENNFNFYLDFPRDVEDIKVYFDDNEKKFEVRKSELNNFANIFGKAAKVKIEYISNYYIEHSSKYYFTAEVNPAIKGKLEIKVILPESATLDKPYDEKSLNSIYPKPSKLETNGKNLIITWEKETESYDPFSLFLVYNYSNFNYGIIISLILLALITFFVFKTIKKRKLKIKKVKIYDIEKHLKSDEKLIIKILKQKKGECTQSTLLTITNMSKASLSRLLDELEKRNIVRKKQQGNKNLILLRK